MFNSKTRRRNRDPGRVALAALMAIVYLTVFLAHDIVYGECTPWPPPAKTTSALSSATAFAEDGNSGLEHHCPFCSGFVDTHVEPEAIWGYVPVSFSTTTQSGHWQSAFRSIPQTRGPPQSFA